MSKKELEEKHGTPEEFAEDVMRAYADLFITLSEASKAIAKYWKEWHEAV